MKSIVSVKAIFLCLIALLAISGQSWSQTLWGVSTDSLGTLYKFNVQQQEFTLLHTFKNITKSNRQSGDKKDRPDNKVVDLISEFRFDTSPKDSITDGYNPAGCLVYSSGNYLYGATYKGGEFDNGTLFRIDTSGNNYETVYSFHGFQLIGNPILIDSLIYICANTQPGSDGVLLAINLNSYEFDTIFTLAYGFMESTASIGFDKTVLVNDYRIFGYNPSTNLITLLGNLPSMAGYGTGSLLQTETGDIYGTSKFGGINEVGVIFQHLQGITEPIKLHTFLNSDRIKIPKNSVVEGANNKLLGCSAWFYNDPGCIYQFDLSSNEFSIIYDFDEVSGTIPGSDLIKDLNQKIYGTTMLGGVNGKGTIFSFDPVSNQITILYDLDIVTGRFPLHGHLIITGDYPLNILPVVFTDQPTGLVDQEINLNGRVNPNGQYLYAWFEYGTDTTMLTTTIPVMVTGDSLNHVTTHINELMFNTVYYYRTASGTDTLHSSDAINGDFVTFRTGPDGIQEVNNQFVIYPNPSDGLFNYTIKEKSEGVIYIYDLRGRKCLQISCDHLQSKGIIDIRSLDDGIYTAVIISESGVLNRRVVKF